MNPNIYHQRRLEVLPMLFSQTKNVWKQSGMIAETMARCEFGNLCLPTQFPLMRNTALENLSRVMGILSQPFLDSLVGWYKAELRNSHRSYLDYDTIKEIARETQIDHDPDTLAELYQ